MSADSMKRMNKCGGCVVRPQPYSDKSVVESVVDFFQDVAYSQNAPKVDEHEKIQWVRFEQADINDLNNNPDCNYRDGNTAPLLLIIGYSNGVQMWTIQGNGEGQEVLSLRQGPVRVLRLLPTPEPVIGKEDIFLRKRPLLALSDASSAGQPYCSVKFVSLRSGDEVHNIPFGSPVVDVKCSPRCLVVAFKENLAVFDSCHYKQLFWVTSCYPCPGPNANPFTLSTRWLAYAERKLVPVHQSSGGMSGDGSQSYAATVISAAKSVSKGLTMFGQTVASLTGSKPPGPTKKDIVGVDNKYKPGVVTILDLHRVKQTQMSVREDHDGEGIVAHFPAHATEPVYAMQFDPSGMMLLTADRLGHNFHLFRIMAHPLSSSQGAVHHMYTLYRGDTTAKVQDIAFTADSRWVTISTYRGTSHVFPVTPYGGSVNMRTHMPSRVVNRASRFHRSAGLEDISQSKSSGRDSPGPGSGSPSSSPRHTDHYRHLNAINNNMGNPRFPPFPHPTTVTPLVQIRQKVNLPGIGGGTGSTNSNSGTGGNLVGHGNIGGSSGGGMNAGGGNMNSVRPQGQLQPENVCVAACFSKSRGWVAGSPGFSTRDKDKPRAVDSLYILSWSGLLVEYILEPHARTGLDKVTDQSPLEVMEIPRAQWILRRKLSNLEVRLPLPSNNPLIVATDAVITQKPSFENLTRQESRESLSSDHSSNQDPDEQWLSQVEIITHAGPHRRLWMGPQFSFKTFQGSSNAATVLSSNSSVLLSQSPEQQVSTMDIVKDDVDLHSLEISPTRSSPVAMPPGSHPPRRRSNSSRHTSGGESGGGGGGGGHCPSPTLHTFIEAGSYEHSPSTDATCDWPDAPLPRAEMGESELQQSLAEAMSETPVKDIRCNRTSLEMDGGPVSLDNLSTSSGSTSSAPKIMTFEAGQQPCIDTVLVFPSSSESTDGSQ